MIADARCSNRLLELAHALSPLTTWLRTPRVAQPALPALPPKRRAVGGVSLRVALKDPPTPAVPAVLLSLSTRTGMED
jgi:hypothetical protein